jgi:hypothetical protein
MTRVSFRGVRIRSTDLARRSPSATIADPGVIAAERAEWEGTRIERTGNLPADFEMYADVAPQRNHGVLPPN